MKKINKKIKFTYKVSWQKIEDEELFYIFDIDNQKLNYYENASYYILNYVEQRLSIGQIIENLSNIYDVECEDLCNDVNEFINDLMNVGYIEFYDEEQ